MAAERERDALQLLLYRELTRGRSLATETDPKGIMRELLSIAGGSVRKAAALAGVSKSAWYDWAKGKAQPSERNLRKLQATLPMRRRHRLPKGREKWLRGQPRVRLTAWTFRKSSLGKKADDQRRRKFEPGQYVPRGEWGPMLDAFLAGDDMADVADMFINIIAYYYEGVTIDPSDVEELEIIPEGAKFSDEW